MTVGRNQLVAQNDHWLQPATAQTNLESDTPSVLVSQAEPRVGFYSPDEKWHLRNVTSDLFQWPLTGVAQVPLFDLVAFFEFYSGCCEGGWGGG